MLSRGFSIEILSKVWKKKALFLMGKACFLKQDFEEAAEHLERALALISGDPNLTGEVKEVMDLLTQAKQKIQKQSKAEKDMWKKAFTKQQEEEKATEELVNSITANSVSPVAAPASSAAPSKASANGSQSKAGTSSNGSKATVVPAAAAPKKKPSKVAAKKEKEGEEGGGSSGFGWNLPTVLGAAAIGVAAVAAVAGIAMMRKK
jgi:cobalamin biosynthesis Mg chelatase CobN